MIEIKLNDSQIQSALQQLKVKIGNMTPAMQDIGEHLLESTQERFATSTGPDGEAWPGAKESSILSYLNKYKSSHKKDGSLSKAGQQRKARKKLLVDSGTLAGSINYKSTSQSVSVGTGSVYGAIHQFGGTTSPHVIRPRNKKALAFGGLVRKKVNHPGSKIPARPFLGFSEDDKSAILEILQRYLRPNGF